MKLAFKLYHNETLGKKTFVYTIVEQNTRLISRANGIILDDTLGLVVAASCPAIYHYTKDRYVIYLRGSNRSEDRRTHYISLEQTQFLEIINLFRRFAESRNSELFYNPVAEVYYIE